MAQLFSSNRPRVELTSRSVWFIALLAWIAGTVNALGYLTVANVFTSHMTGNAAAVVITLVIGRGTHTLRRLAVLLTFVGGAAAGTVLVERHKRHSAAGALFFEAALLSIGALLASLSAHAPATNYELLCLAGAMGVQNIALTGSALSAHTTHITGPLTDFASTAVRRFVGRRELSRDRSHGFLVYGGRVLAFVGGIASGAALSRFGAGALFVPSVATAIGATILWRSS